VPGPVTRRLQEAFAKHLVEWKARGAGQEATFI